MRLKYRWEDRICKHIIHSTNLPWAPTKSQVPGWCPREDAALSSEARLCPPRAQRLAGRSRWLWGDWCCCGEGQDARRAPRWGTYTDLGLRVQGRPFQRQWPIGRGRNTPTAGANGEAVTVGEQAPKGRRLERRARQVHGQSLGGNPHLGHGRRNRNRTWLWGKSAGGAWVSEGGGSLIC